jgi:hypothetical protein
MNRPSEGNGLMRSGKWMHAALRGLPLFLALSPGGMIWQAAAGQSATSASRRLPHRPHQLVGYAQEDFGTESIMKQGDLIPPPELPGEPTETIWEPSEVMVEDVGDTPRCDGGPVCWPGIQLNHLSFFGGVQAAKNNSTRGEDASFGFHQGLNFGTAARNVILPASMGVQVGFQATQSNIEGASFTNDDRKQYFLTAGAFRRCDHGLQGGLVFDYLWDTWNYDLQAGQMRGELSMAITHLSSFGFWFTSSVTEEVVTASVSGADIVETWDTVDYYALFYRTGLFAGGRGEGQMMAGLTEDSDGIIGGKARMPLINGWALETEFTYLVPDEPRGAGANEHESWNLGVSLVWYPGTLSCGECFREHRPMFDVANNGSLILSASRP